MYMTHAEINETIRTKYNLGPMLAQWEFLFPKKQNLEIMNKILVKFGNELYVGHEKMVDISAIGEISLRGKVYGDSRFEKGDDIITSPVKTIERVDWKPDNKTWLNGSYSLDEVATFTDKEVFCATTESGSKYYFVNDDPSGNMFLYLGMVIHGASA